MTNTTVVVCVYKVLFTKSSVTMSINSRNEDGENHGELLENARLCFRRTDVINASLALMTSVKDFRNTV